MRARLRQTSAPATPAVVAKLTALELHREHLRDELLPTVELLQRRRADLVDEALIAEYVALSWFDWSGGSLKLTQTGSNICSQIRAGLR